MPRINSRLLDAIVAKTGLSRSQVYARIQQTASAEMLPRQLAAIRVGADSGLAINKWATSGELAELRNAGAPVLPPSAVPQAAGPRIGNAQKNRTTKSAKRSVPNSVFVVHGRDIGARDAVFAFLRAVGIKPIEWTAAIGMTKKAAPYVGEILNVAFTRARAIVVLMTPDDLAQLRPDLLSSTDKPYERTPTGQARPNVLFEAGMAFATHPGQTVIVQLGNVREFSDIAGRHVVHMSNDNARRQEFATKLENAGCDVDRTGADWFTAGDFTDPLARSPAKSGRKRRQSK